MNKEKPKKKRGKIVKSTKTLGYPVRGYKASEIKEFLELDKKESK